MKFHLFAATLACSLCCALSGNALAQAYPNKPVKFVVASVGSPQDVVGRLFAQKIADSWGQPIVIENRPGAGVLLSAQTVVKAAADGYTVLVSSAAFTVTPWLYPQLGYDSEKDLIPVGLLAVTPNILVTSPSTGIKTLKDAVERARSGAKMQYGSPGYGTTPQLSAEYLFKSLAKVHIQHIPYKGTPPLITAAIAGEVEIVTSALPAMVPQIKAGKLIGLAVTSAKRNPLLPDVPTIAEAGFTGFEDDSWVGVWVPAGTPAAAIAKLRDEIDRAGAATDVRERLRNAGFETSTLRGEAFAQLVRRELDKWARVVKETGAKAE